MTTSGASSKSRRIDPVVPAGWADFYRDTHIPAAVRRGEWLHLTGHTGDADDGTFPEDLEEQIRQTFRNVATTLEAAGAQWSDVVEVTTYHVGLRAQAEALLSVAAEFLDHPYPAWTAVGVTELFELSAVIEIQCLAVLPT